MSLPRMPPSVALDLARLRLALALAFAFALASTASTACESASLPPPVDPVAGKPSGPGTGPGAGAAGGAGGETSSPRPAANAAAAVASAEALRAGLDAPGEAEITTDVRAANAFTLKALARTRKPTENAMVSGTSVRHALGATYLGARGATATEMATALGLGADAKSVERLAHAELAAWKDVRGKAELNVASRLWADESLGIQPAFATAAETAFGAPLGRVAYATPEGARKTINAWVSASTKDKIKELLPQGSVDPRTRLVVTNAIWFKGGWEFPFPKGATKDEPFTVGAKTVSAPTMHLTDALRFASEGGVRILELRYAESQIAMLLVLPDDAQPSTFAKLQADLRPDTLEKWTAALATARVNVTLPRFTFRSGGPMSATLQELGMKTAFTEKADFAGIAEASGGARLHLSQVFHETWIALDELGTEAAAATGGVMRTTSLITGPIAEFKADHPFLFFVRDTKHQRVLFAGRVVDPKAN